MMLSIRGFTRDDRIQNQNQSRNMTKTHPLFRFLFRKHADVTVQCSSMENCRCTELEGGHYGGHCVPLLHDTDLQHSQVCFLKRHHPQVLACVYACACVYMAPFKLSTPAALSRRTGRRELAVYYICLSFSFDFRLI